ncbi:uncharacterized protein Dwil_GK19911 [Drosophila willistoni]|uniref:Importin N-terminal domain-containing protein n=1 Tax=Drosophila willistoni TaxID=7260 RepID=B4MSF6_DROWI|nr:uncharacterized protein Dwil_GK19911 [Drosophila willistoni]
MTSVVTRQLIAILEKTVSPDKDELFYAENILEQAASGNLPEFLMALSEILVNITNSPVARIAAGLQLKNHLTSKDVTVSQQYQERWHQFPDSTRELIKYNILSALGTENTRPSCAAQCVAYVAVIELPINRWGMLIQTLVNKVVDVASSEMHRESALEAIGYICQDIQYGVLETQSNQLLTAIIHGMRELEPSNHVRLAATTALTNSLEFTKANFEQDMERNFIMEVVCGATQCPDAEICVAAMQCLVKIMTLYYQFMEPYMAQALFPITLDAMRSEYDAIAMQGIEFWSNVCDEEIDLAIDSGVSKHYARGALRFLAPLLVEKLTKQDECDYEDTWSPAKANVCWAFIGLSNAAYDAAMTAEGETPETYSLSPYFEVIITHLLESTDRFDGGAQSNLRSAAYEALMNMIKNSPRDCHLVVQRTTIVILERLNRVIQMDQHINNHSDRHQINDLQSLLCATLQSVLRKLHKEDAPQISDAIMTSLLAMFQSSAGKSGGVQEDALMAVSTLIELLGIQFAKYMPAFKDVLIMGLKNHNEYQVCCAAVGLTGDICCALKHLIVPYCDEIMSTLMSNLVEPTLHRSVKPEIVSAFGDMALSIGSDFLKYLNMVLEMLKAASNLQTDANIHDEYINELRESVLGAYTGIIQGLQDDDVLHMEPHLMHIIGFIKRIAQEEGHVSDTRMASAAGLIGDLCSSFGPRLYPLLDDMIITQFLAKGKRSKLQRAKMLSTWAANEIKKINTRSSRAQ